jgi:hypothetical protein
MLHSSLLCKFTSYKGTEALWIRPQVPYSKHSIFFINYKWEQ